MCAAGFWVNFSFKNIIVKAVVDCRWCWWKKTQLCGGHFTHELIQMCYKFLNKRAAASYSECSIKGNYTVIFSRNVEMNNKGILHHLHWKKTICRRWHFLSRHNTEACDKCNVKWDVSEVICADCEAVDALLTGRTGSVKPRKQQLKAPAWSAPARLDSSPAACCYRADNTRGRASVRPSTLKALVGVDRAIRTTRTRSRWVTYSSSSSPRLLLLDRFLAVFGTVDTGKGWHSQVCPHTIGGINRCHKVRHSLSLTTVAFHLYERAFTLSSWPDIVLSALSVDSNSSKWTRALLCRWPSVLLGWSLCHATQLIIHQGRSTLATMWYKHLVLRC